MDSYAYYNGSFGKYSDITVPLSDRAIYFGDAIYDAAIGSYDRILWEEEHINRFLLNAESVGIDHNFTAKYLSSLLKEIAVKSMMKCYFIYFQISRSLPHRTHSSLGAKANLLITVNPIKIDPPSKKLALITVSDKRFSYCHIKTTNLLPSVIASTKAEKAGCDEAIFVRGKYVTECAKSNISILNDGRLITHPKNNRILPGIAREHLLITCKAIGIPFYERPFTVKEMLFADEILVTSTTKLCKSVNRINGMQVGGKSPETAESICKKMHEEFKNYCHL